MNALDRRLIDRVSGAREMLFADAALGFVAALMVLAQAILIARIAARGFDGAGVGDVTPELVALAARYCEPLGRPSGGSRSLGRRAAAGRPVDAAPRSSSSARLRATGGARRRRGARVAAAAVGGVDALEAYFARYLPQVVLAVLVPVAVLVCRRDRPRLGAIDAADAAARAAVHVADRPLHASARARALAGAAPARRPTSSTSSAACRRCARSTAARPRPTDRAGQRRVPPQRRWARCGSRSSPGRCSSWRRRSASRSSPSRSACGSSTATSSFQAGADGPAARAGAVPAAAEPRRAVPRERRRPRGRRSAARAARRRKRAATCGHRARPPSPADVPIRLRERLASPTRLATSPSSTASISSSSRARRLR